ncbi:MAG: Holliday junction branch migration protein RuvA [bacterium]|nr:Holliday junction branch migration protein RuvA [bacterium]
MIDTVSGILIKKLPTSVVIDVNGIGYELHIPLSTFNELPQENQRVKLFTRLVVTNNSLTLYGFATLDEREIFDSLTKISGIGYKIGLKILSSCEVVELKKAISSQDLDFLTSISGIGKKTAQRLILELKDKLEIKEDDTSLDGNVMEEAILGLISLGYTKTAARKLIREAKNNTKDLTTENLIRSALKLVREMR